ncbi:hypothetical protein ATC03_05445 [Agromyces aureus]|uniref:DNA modification methylase n=1 Tax=Agromyces aureus TaxID=453304 RepID=A0A191WK99_9MICO|nr:hypothetical protein ATC03_05445 [Agromyces aureus]
MAAIGAIATAALLLGGCSAPPWLSGATASPTPSASATSTAGPVQNDLAAGAVTRTIEVGAITLTIDYWSTLSMDLWTAAANKPLSFSVHATVTPADGQKIYLAKVTATPVVAGSDGALPAPDPIVDQASVAPGYLVLDPYSYSQTFIVPPLDSAATSLELTVKYELLLQSTPTSSDYAKQTAVDTLSIAIAPEPAG